MSVSSSVRLWHSRPECVGRCPRSHRHASGVEVLLPVRPFHDLLGTAPCDPVPLRKAVGTSSPLPPPQRLSGQVSTLHTEHRRQRTWVAAKRDVVTVCS